MSDCRICATPLPADARFCMACGTDVTDPGATVRTGPRTNIGDLQDRLTRTLAGRYAVKQLLGAGGMAAVYLAEEIGLDRLVAIKVLPPELTRDESLVARFQREAKTAAKLDHSNIIPIYRVESEGGLHYFVMKYVAGRSLEALLHGEEPLALEAITRILCEAALALGHAHARGVVHRDVKPANIMLDQDGRVVLADFGISKAIESTQLTQTGMIIGTPDYMSPEQIMGTTVDGRADQYALGVVAYQMLTQQCPFTGDSAHTLLYRHIHETPKPVGELRPDVPRHLADAVAAALAKEPDERFASMEDFARALQGDRDVRPGLGTRAAKVHANDSDATPRAPIRRTRVRAVVGTVLAGAAVLAAVWLFPLVDRSEPASEARTPARPTQPSLPTRDTRTALVQDSTAALSQVQPQGEPRRVTAQRTERHDRPDRKQTAPLTVASEPYGVLFIDDVEVGDTPVANRPLEVGRTYRIRVEREGYKTRRETINVTGPNPIRRNYVLDPGSTP